LKNEEKKTLYRGNCWEKKVPHKMFLFKIEPSLLFFEIQQQNQNHPPVAKRTGAQSKCNGARQLKIVE